MRHLAILGATGSIGTSTLEVVAAHPDRLSIVALAGGRNRELLLSQCERHHPSCVSMALAEDAAWLSTRLSYRPEIHHGAEGLLASALHSDADTVDKVSPVDLAHCTASLAVMAFALADLESPLPR